MDRYITVFDFYKHTPLTDFQNTIHFESNQERDDFFNEGHYQTLNVSDIPFNFIRDRSSVVLPKDKVSYNQMRGVNYCRFISQFENQYYYAFVIDYEYLNHGAIRVNLLIDTVMTYTQGRVLEDLTNLNVHRQHLTNGLYNQNIWELQNNDDVIKAFTKNYTYEDGYYFEDFIALIHSSVDLTAEFGQRDDPIVVTSQGGEFDRVVSPLNIYMVPIEHFREFSRKLSRYAWIAQNIQKIVMIPSDFFNLNSQFNQVDTNFDFNYLYEAQDGVVSQDTALNNKLDEISLSHQDLYDIYDLDPVEDRHLLRNEYHTLELYTWDGQRLLVDLGQLNENKGFDLVSEKLIGYENEIAIFIDDYKISTRIRQDRPNGKQATQHKYKGSYLNDAIIFKDFDSLPVLVDNAQLGLAKTANQRQLAESKLISNQIGTLFSDDASAEERFFNGVNLISNLDPSNLLGRFTEEYDYYRERKAESKDLALETPTITEQTHSNSYQIKNGTFGISVKASRPTREEMTRIKYYYKSNGYDWGRTNTQLANVESMSICNFIKFDGQINLDLMDVGLQEMIESLFSIGVRFWHNNGTPNPMNQNLLENKRVV